MVGWSHGKRTRRTAPCPPVSKKKGSRGVASNGKKERFKGRGKEKPHQWLTCGVKGRRTRPQRGKRSKGDVHPHKRKKAKGNRIETADRRRQVGTKRRGKFQIRAGK